MIDRLITGWLVFMVAALSVFFVIALVLGSIELWHEVFP